MRGQTVAAAVLVHTKSQVCVITNLFNQSCWQHFGNIRLFLAFLFSHKQKWKEFYLSVVGINLPHELSLTQAFCLSDSQYDNIWYEKVAILIFCLRLRLYVAVFTCGTAAQPTQWTMSCTLHNTKSVGYKEPESQTSSPQILFTL